MDLPKRKKILVLEEDTELVQYLNDFVPLLGPYEVEQAFDDLNALAKLNAFEPELLVLDKNLAQIHSEHILEEVKKKHPHTKVLMITGAGQQANTSRPSGANEVMAKPIDFTELSYRLKRLLPTLENGQENARLLIVDDEPELNEFLKDFFVSLGLEVSMAQDGEKALEIFKEENSNLILLDIKLPKIEGRDLFHQMEGSIHPAKPKAIFFLTAALGADVDELKRLGLPVFTKPADLEQLGKAVLQACERHHLALRNASQKIEG